MTIGEPAYEPGKTSMPRPLVVIESPFKADTFEQRTRNVKLIMNLCRMAVMQGYNPYASHLFFTSFLKDEVPDERNAGIQCGFAWARFAEEVWFVLRTDEVMSGGMVEAHNQHLRMRRRLRYFRTDDNGLSVREVTMFQGGYIHEQAITGAAEPLQLPEATDSGSEV